MRVTLTPTTAVRFFWLISFGCLGVNCHSQVGLGLLLRLTDAPCREPEEMESNRVLGAIFYSKSLNSSRILFHDFWDCIRLSGVVE